jgi:DNA polymerase III epsilon subunit-like protein
MSTPKPLKKTGYKTPWKPPPAKVTAISHPKLPSGEAPPIILCFDTETTDKPPKPANPYEKQLFNDKEIPAEKWPRILQLGFVLYDTGKQEIIKNYDKLVKLKKTGLIQPGAAKVHGITEEKSQSEGRLIKEVMMDFIHAFNQAKFVVGHNVQFDINVILAELTLLLRSEDEVLNDEEKPLVEEVIKKLLHPDNNYCTMQHSKPECKLPKLTYTKEGEVVIDLITKKEVIDEQLDYQGKRKMRNPKLEVAHEILFQQKQNGKAHDAFVDVAICLRIFMKLYLNIDILDAKNRSKNQLIYDTLKPTDLSPSELPRRIGDKPVHPNVVNRMNSIQFDKFPKEKTPTVSQTQFPSSPSGRGKENITGISEKLTSLSRSIKKSQSRTPRGTRKAKAKTI